VRKHPADKRIDEADTKKDKGQLPQASARTATGMSDWRSGVLCDIMVTLED